jgi:hypothetical protein
MVTARWSWFQLLSAGGAGPREQRHTVRGVHAHAYVTRAPDPDRSCRQLPTDGAKTVTNNEGQRFCGDGPRSDEKKGRVLVVGARPRLGGGLRSLPGRDGIGTGRRLRYGEEGIGAGHGTDQRPAVFPSRVKCTSREWIRVV